MFHRHRKRFIYAFHGLLITVKEEASFRFQVVVFVLVMTLSAWLGLSALEWAAVIIVSGSVLVLECLNSALERMIDAIEPRLHGTVAIIKDILAGAVLIMSLVAVVVGLIIFVPKIM